MNRYLAAGIAALFLLGFAILYGLAICETLRWDESKPDVKFNEYYILFATGMAGLVAAVVANAMRPVVAKQILRADWDVIAIASGAYVFVFFLVGVAAIIAAIRWNPADPVKHPFPDLLKNIAMLSFGLLASMIRLIFNVPDPPEGGKAAPAKKGDDPK